MSDERRNDLGTKIKDGLTTAGISIILGLFIHTTWLTANEGKNKGIDNSEEIVRQAAKVEALKEMILLILDDVKDIKVTLQQQKEER